MKENRRAKLCCCDQEAFVHKFTLLTLFVDVIVFFATTVLYFDLIFGKYLVDALHFIYIEDALTHK